MKRLFRFLLVPLLLCVPALAMAQDWTTYKLDEFVSVDAPAGIVPKDTSGIRLYAYPSLNGSIVFTVSTTPGHMPEDRAALDKAYAEAVNGSISGVNGTLIDSSTVIIHGLRAKKVRIEFTQPATGGKVIYESIYILGNNKLYSFQYFQPFSAQDGSVPDSERFFNSISISDKFTARNQLAAEDSLAFRIGYLVGKIAIAIGLIIGIIFLMKRVNK